MPALARFSRSSVASLDSGVQMAANQARYEGGKFPNTKALRLEESVTNLLTANQSNIETSTTGFGINASGTTLSRDTAEHWEGAASLKVVTDGSAANQGPTLLSVVTAPATTPYTFSVYLKGSGTVQLTLNGAGIASTSSTTITLSGTWTQYSITGTSDGDGGAINVVIHTATTQAITFWCDGLQFEQAAYATGWQIGGTPRTAETVWLSGKDIINADEGTFECWVKFDSALGTSDNRILFDTRQPADNYDNTQALVFYVDSALKPTLRFGTGSSTVTIAGASGVSASAWVHLACKWSSAGATVIANGATVATSASVPSLVVPPRFWLGSTGAPASSLNGLFSGVRISNTAHASSAIWSAYYFGTLDLPFTEEGDTTLLLTCDGTLRGKLSDRNFLFVPEANFLSFTPSATTTASGFPVENVADDTVPGTPHRSTVTTQTDIICDLISMANLRAVCIEHTNYEAFTLATSVDGVTYTDLTGSPFYALADLRDSYRKFGLVVAVACRYVRVRIIAQTPDDDASFFETGLIILADDVNGLRQNPDEPLEYEIQQAVLSQEAGGRIEEQAAGPVYCQMTMHGVMNSAKRKEWLEMGLLGRGKKFLMLRNNSNSEEAYLWTPTGGVTVREFGQYYEINQSYRQLV